MTMSTATEKERFSVDWSDGITVDLLTLISSNFDSIESHIASAAVCRSWYNVIASYRISEPTPWLMLSEKQDSASRSFFSFRGNNVFDMKFPPEIKGRRCWGSQFGWIITYDSNNDDMNLYNPLSKASIPLPKLLPYFAKKYGLRYRRGLIFPVSLIKAILTSNPGSPNCMVFIVPTTYDVVYAKPRDTVWSVVSGANLGDILSFRGILYGCEWKTGNIVTLNYVTDFPNQLVLKGFAEGPPEMINRSQEVANEYYRKKYLVDLGGELYMVFCYFFRPFNPGPPCIRTYDFEIYKIDLSAKVWKIVKSLGDHCLFIGTNNAFAVSVSYDHQDEASGNGISLRPKCIYFLDDEAFYNQKSDGSDIGVFHVGERKFGARPLGENAPLFRGYNHNYYHTHSPQPFMLKTLASGLYSHSCPPLWITPYLQLHKPSYRDHHQQQIEAKDRKLPNMKVLVGPYVKMTPDVEYEEGRKLIIQLKNQFTYTEKNGVNRRPCRRPRPWDELF